MTYGYIDPFVYEDDEMGLSEIERKKLQENWGPLGYRDEAEEEETVIFKRFDLEVKRVTLPTSSKLVAEVWAVYSPKGDDKKTSESQTFITEVEIRDGGTISLELFKRDREQLEDENP